MDGSLPGSSFHRIFQARVLEWVAIAFSRRPSQPRDGTQVSHTVGRRFTIWTTREGKAEWCNDNENNLRFPKKVNAELPSVQFSSVQFSSVQFSCCAQLCDPMARSTLLGMYSREIKKNPQKNLYVNSIVLIIIAKTWKQHNVHQLMNN